VSRKCEGVQNIIHISGPIGKVYQGRVGIEYPHKRQISTIPRQYRSIYAQDIEDIRIYAIVLVAQCCFGACEGN